MFVFFVGQNGTESEGVSQTSELPQGAYDPENSTIRSFFFQTGTGYCSCLTKGLLITYSGDIYYAAGNQWMPKVLDAL